MPRKRREEEYSESSEEDDSSSEEESSEEEESSDDGEDDSSGSGSYESEEDKDDEESYDEDDYDEDEGEYSDEEDYDPLSDALDALIDSVVDYEDPNECWDYVRQWLQEHSMEETKEAVELKGEFDTTALHVACRNKPPVDVVEVMLMAAPDDFLGG